MYCILTQVGETKFYPIRKHDRDKTRRDLEEATQIPFTITSSATVIHTLQVRNSLSVTHRLPEILSISFYFYNCALPQAAKTKNPQAKITVKQRRTKDKCRSLKVERNWQSRRDKSRRCFIKQTKHVLLHHCQVCHYVGGAATHCGLSWAAATPLLPCKLLPIHKRKT